MPDFEFGSSKVSKILLIEYVPKVFLMSKFVMCIVYAYIIQTMNSDFST